MASESSARQASSSPTGSSVSIALTGPIEAGDMEMERKPMPISAMAEIGLPASSPHSVTGVQLRLPASAICLQHAQERHRQRIEPVGELAACRDRSP